MQFRLNSEPTICIKCINKQDITLEWFRNWLIRVTREYMRHQYGKESRGRYEYRVTEEYWTYMSELHSNRGIQSVALDLDTEVLLRKDLNSFISSKKFYSNIGVPYKRGIMLSGRPGVGKTSLIHAISASLDRSLYFLNLKQLKTDSNLQRAISELPTNVILVFEDIDAQSNIVHKRSKNIKAKEAVTGTSKLITPVIEESPNVTNQTIETPNMFAALAALSKGATEKSTESLTLSTLLGCLDGYIMPEGTIFIFTTNHPEVLDPALIRPGRVDLHLELGYCTQYQLSKMFCTVMDDDTAELPNLKSIPEHVIPPCEAMRILCLYREDGANVVSKHLMARAQEIVSGSSVLVDDLVQMRIQEEIELLKKDEPEKGDGKVDIKNENLPVSEDSKPKVELEANNTANEKST
ncbi:hypothetical protein HK096_001456 [Nowakowskiella sp. JEL0078]|nr:hypothetical protein HK096_001456 [Nowakowskiella sp. JEL0078]